MGVIGLQNKVLLLNNIIIYGFPYESWSWSRISMMDIVKFHPTRVGVLDTLNWAVMLVSNMWKHALAMFLYNKK